MDELNGTLTLTSADDQAAIHPLYGTTIYIGRSHVETIYGPFEILTFQDLIHKGYILALVKGNVKTSDKVYTRLHSSCVTSETLGSMDCDCVQQLNGALEVISQKECGILFYLIQEGRGCGYVGKSRDRMLVQYHNDTITTFDAYRMQGMVKDYRNYRNIADICHIMSIQPKFVLLTNNPDKVNALINHGLTVDSVENIEVPPNPFNQQYLTSKQQSGHLLVLVKNKVQSFQLPVPPNAPFAPHSIPEASRFVLVASYYLPIRPNFSILTKEEYESLGIPLPYELSADGEYLVYVISEALYEQHPTLLRRPYWFQVHVYYDIKTQTEFVVLEYRDCKNAKRPPYVRIHSESIFSRFPLKSSVYKQKYYSSIEAIVKNGVGMVILMYHDGRGFGLGSFIIEQQTDYKQQHEQQQQQQQPQQQQSAAGDIQTDLMDGRDFAGAALLIRRHCSTAPFVMLYSTNSSKRIYKKHFPNVTNFLWIGDVSDSHGQQLLATRNRQIGDFLTAPNNSIKMSGNLDRSASYLVTGIGSSEAHARFLVEVFKTVNISAKFIPIATPLSQIQSHDKLIVFSQGMSPHTQDYVNRADVLFTAVTEKNSDQKKVALLKNILARGGVVVWFPLEDEYQVLIRLVGPFFGYVAVMHSVGLTSKIPEARALKLAALRMPSTEFSDSAIASGRLSILLPSEMISYSQNLVSKWVEGMYFSPPFINDYLSWIHGAYQSIATNKVVTPHVLFTTGVEPVEKVKELLDQHPVWIVQIEYGILEIEMVMNYWLLSLMNQVRVNQRDWPGKAKEAQLYNSRFT